MMKQTDQNILMITAGGIGLRFGDNTPKQYHLLDGKPVLAHVIEACKTSREADAILVVAAPEYHEMLRREYQVDVACNGPVLNQSKRNGFDYIREHSSCEKLVVVEGVRPFINGQVLDKTFRLLDEYDAVACARKITDSIGCYHEWILDREQYYTLNPPEGFRFPLLDRCFDAASPLTESIQQLPETSSVYLNFDVPYFEKITYPEDIARATAMLQYWKDKKEELL